MLSTIDADNPNDIHTYTLSGVDVASFQVQGNELQSAEIFNLGTKSTYQITITTTDASDSSYSENFIVTINSNPILSIVIDSLPYVENFENNSHGWTTSDLIWELGEPNQINLNSASQGSRAWMTDLDANYPNSASSFLITPIFDFSDLSEPRISFDINYILENTYDGLTLEYSVDGNPFVPIPFSAGIANWYNSDLRTGNTQFWSGSSGNYVKAVANLDFLAGESNVQFAFVLSSDGSVNQEGVALDVFEISFVNRPPSDITLSNNTIAQNQPIGTLIGTLISTDVNNPNDTHIYTLSGVDAASFHVQGNELQSAEIFNFATKSTYQITITTTDAGDSSYSENFIINITPNQPPSDITLSNNTIAENQPIGTLIGMLTSTDADDDIHIYTLSGVDVASFQVQGNELQSAEIFNFATKSTYQITITTTDGGDPSYSENFIINITPNQLPSDITLSNNTIAENQPIGTLIGMLTLTGADGDTHIYTLSGVDAASFQVQGNELQSAEIFNFATKSTYQITITTTDGDDSNYSENFIINITPNQPPSDITLSNNTIAENQPIGTLIGMLTSTDADDDTHIYTLSGVDVASFQVQGNELQSAEIFNFATKSTYQITITTTDGGDPSYSENFIINITPNQPPSDITLSNNTIAENQPIGTLIGMLTSTDADDDTHIYTLSGVDVASFQVQGNELQSAEIFNFATKSTYQITITTTDGGDPSYSENFIINITPNQPPSDITLSNNTIAENQPIGTLIGMLTLTGADGDTHIYTLSGVDAASFQVQGNELQSAEIFNFATKSTYQITITTTDGGGSSYSENFIISITPNQPPSDMTLSNKTIAQGHAVGTLIGVLSTIDADNPNDTHIYTLSGVDATSFQLQGNELLSAEIFNFITKSTYQITITTTDAGNFSYSKDFTIDIGNITALLNPLSQNNILLYPNPATNNLKISGLKNLRDVKIYFISIEGQVVKTYNTPQSEYDISDLPNGTYIAVILKDDKRKMITFFIN